MSRSGVPPVMAAAVRAQRSATGAAAPSVQKNLALACVPAPLPTLSQLVAPTLDATPTLAMTPAMPQLGLALAPVLAQVSTPTMELAPGLEWAQVQSMAPAWLLALA